MPFDLVLITGKKADEKYVGENVYVTDLPGNAHCYALYYPGAMPSPTLEDGLRDLGEQTGNNLFVNIGRLDDPNYNKIARLFEIGPGPVIVVTAIAPLAAPADDFANAYVRLDDPRLLGSVDKTLQSVVEIFNLFQQGKVAEAIEAAGSSKRSAQLDAILQALKKPLSFLWDYISERDLVVSFAEGRLELTKPKSDG